MSSTSVTSDPRAVARANAWHALAHVLRQPSRLEIGALDRFDVVFGDLSDVLGELASQVAMRWRESSHDLEPLDVAYAKLFVGPFEVMASPYASTYLDPEQRLMGPVSRYVERAFEASGLSLRNEPREVPDHICHEAEFMYYLIFQQIEGRDPRSTECQERFWTEHLGRWLPDFAACMRNAAQHPFYDALAELILAFAGEEDRALRVVSR
jgi:putative dimethyl sulfoxide reductase chaperone